MWAKCSLLLSPEHTIPEEILKLDREKLLFCVHRARNGLDSWCSGSRSYPLKCVHPLTCLRGSSGWALWSCHTCKGVAQGLRRSLPAHRCHYALELQCCPFSSTGDVHPFLLRGDCQEARSLSVTQSRALLGKKPQQFVWLRYWENSCILMVKIHLDVPGHTTF